MFLQNSNTVQSIVNVTNFIYEIKTRCICSNTHQIRTSKLNIVFFVFFLKHMVKVTALETKEKNSQGRGWSQEEKRAEETQRRRKKEETERKQKLNEETGGTSIYH